MASSPEGPGWWQASDGQWYPPESHPNYRPPAAPPTAPPTEQYQLPPTQPTPQYQAPPAAPPYQAPTAPPAYGQPNPYGQPPQGPPPGQYVGGAYGAPPPAAPPASGKGKGILIAAIVVAVLLIAGVLVAVLAGGSDDDSADGGPEVIVGGRDTGSTTGGQVGTDPDKSIKEDAPDATSELDIVGPSSGPENAVISAAIVDIQSFWTDEMPDAYGAEYQPVEGGFFSWSPDESLPPCVDSPDNISGNAFYCGQADVIAWDDSDLIPHLYNTYGDLSVAIVFAHEWGHAIQARVGMEGATVTLEQQADCFAGAWVQHVQSGGSNFFTADGPALDQALAGFLEIADTPGTSAMDENAHGSAFDRINSFQEGLEGGAATCSGYSDETVGPRLVELEFESQEDFDAGGNAPYEDIIELSTSDLEDYWSKIGQQDFGATWTTLSPAQAFDGTSGESPPCGDSDTSGYTLFYCAEDNFVAYDDVGLFPEVYDSLGDFAVGALYGSQYSLAAQNQFGIAPDDARDQNLMADCMTGSWAASIFLQDRITDQDEVLRLQLSPGDFDEAIKVLLALGSREEDGGTQGTGFERVTAFRKGVINGVEACTSGG